MGASIPIPGLTQFCVNRAVARPGEEHLALVRPALIGDTQAMTTQACGSCTTQIRYGPKHEGKTVRCPKCGEPVHLPVIDELNEPNDSGYEIAPEAPRPAAPAPMPMMPAAAATQTMPSSLRTERVQRSFWSDVGKSFTFLTDLDNTVVIIGYALMMTIYPVIGMIPLLGFFAMFVFYGMLYAFYFDVVRTTAGGDDDLPSLSEWDGFIDSALAPTLSFVGTTLIASLPGIAAIVLTLESPGGASTAIIAAAFAIGWFFWPAIVLAVATLGWGLVLRADLLIRTPFSAFGAYLSVYGLLLVAGGLGWLGASAFLSDSTHRAMESMNVEPVSVLGVLFLAFESFVLNAIGISSSVIAMRAIGLFYRHFSQRFPWSAG